MQSHTLATARGILCFHKYELGEKWGLVTSGVTWFPLSHKIWIKKLDTWAVREKWWLLKHPVSSKGNLLGAWKRLIKLFRARNFHLLKQKKSFKNMDFLFFEQGKFPSEFFFTVGASKFHFVKNKKKFFFGKI